MVFIGSVRERSIGESDGLRFGRGGGDGRASVKMCRKIRVGKVVWNGMLR